MSIVFDALCAHYNISPGRKGECWIECPYCGKGKRHFSFSERGYKCFSCNQKGSLMALAAHAGASTTSQYPSRLYQKPQELQKPRNWQLNPGRYVDDFCAVLDRIQRWQEYKPLSLDTIARWRLGVGVLTATKCKHRRLIVPIYLAGNVVALRGRAISCDCPKWLSAAGSQAALYNQDLLKAGADLIVCENHVDALLAMQHADVVAVASTAGAGTWKPEWTQAIAESKPRRVIVWYDNDLAGQPNAETYRAELLAWREEHPDGWRAPQPNGPKVANDLLEAGVKAVLYHWPRGTPVKADLAYALERRLRRAA